jgi:hypothetical protein
MNRHPTPMKARIVMWAAIAGSLALLGVLLALGWGEGAWTTAAGVLLLACVFVCIWAGVQSRTTDREVRRAVARIATARQTRVAAHRSGTPTGQSPSV